MQGPRRRSRRWPWLVAALVLLAGGAWLMSRGERMPPPREVQVTFPRHMSLADHQRQRQRQRPPILAVPESSEPEAVARPAPPPRPRDPLLLAMPPSVEKVAMVVEANALRHSPIGELLLDCFVGSPEDDELGRMRSKTGLDVFEDLDRVAVTDDVVFVSGRFAGAHWAEIFSGMKEQTPGLTTRVWKQEAEGGEAALLWNDEMVIVSQRENEVRAAADRLEGRVPPASSVIDEDDCYGEIYGVVSSQAVASLFEHDSPEVAAKLRSITEQVKLHVDASHDVGIVADARGNDAAGALDLAKTLGGALALGRAAARAQGNDNLATFLDYASVHPGASGAFRVELALPLDYLQTLLKDCPGRKARSAGSR